jgi:hypothetical protein
VLVFVEKSGRQDSLTTGIAEAKSSLAYNNRMFEQLEELREKPAVTRGTVIVFLLMIFLLGIMVGAQLANLVLRGMWNAVGIGETFLVCVLLWRLSVPQRKLFKSPKLQQDMHAK